MPWVYFRSLMRHGGSLVVSLPRHTVRNWQLAPKDVVAIEIGNPGYLRIYPAKGVTDATGPIPDRAFVADHRTPRPAPRVHRPRKAGGARR